MITTFEGFEFCAVEVKMWIDTSFEYAIVDPIVRLGRCARDSGCKVGIPALIWSYTGNAARPGRMAAAEANIFHDPEAAAIVFAAPWSMTMVGLDVTMRSLITEEHRARLRATSECERLRAQVQSITTPEVVAARELEHRRYLQAVRS